MAGHFKHERHSADQDHPATHIYEGRCRTLLPQNRGPRGPVMEIWRSRIVAVSIRFECEMGMRLRDQRGACPFREAAVDRWHLCPTDRTKWRTQMRIGQRAAAAVSAAVCKGGDCGVGDHATFLATRRQACGRDT